MHPKVASGKYLKIINYDETHEFVIAIAACTMHCNYHYLLYNLYNSKCKMLIIRQQLNRFMQ